MNKLSLLKVVLPLSFVMTAFTLNVAHAEQPQRKHGYHHSADSYTREIKQTATENGFIRDIKTTNATGETATRNTTVSNDKASGTHTRTVTGTNFKGENYSEKSITHKTDNGYVSEEQHVGADGKVISRSVNAVVDKSAGTVTKTISTTPESGVTSTKTIVRKVHKRE